MINEEKVQKHIVIVNDEPVNLALATNVLDGHYKLAKLISGAQLLQFLTRISRI